MGTETLCCSSSQDKMHRKQNELLCVKSRPSPISLSDHNGYKFTMRAFDDWEIDVNTGLWCNGNIGRWLIITCWCASINKPWKKPTDATSSQSCEALTLINSANLSWQRFVTSFNSVSTGGQMESHTRVHQFHWSISTWSRMTRSCEAVREV